METLRDLTFGLSNYIWGWPDVIPLLVVVLLLAATACAGVISAEADAATLRTSRINASAGFSFIDCTFFLLCPPHVASLGIMPRSTF